MHSSFRPSRNHTVHNFGDIAPPNLVSETNCRIHNRYPLDLFDKSCNMSICCRCLRVEHAGHEVEDLDEAALRSKQRIEQHAKDLSVLLSHQQTHLQSIRQDMKNTSSTQNTLKDTIGQTFQSLRSQLDQREKELLIGLEAQTEETREILQSLQTTREDEHVRCTNASEYIRTSLLWASKSVLLKLESSVDGVTRNYLETTSPKPYDVAAAVFTTNGLSKLRSCISEFGTVSETGGNKTDDKGTQTDDIFATLKQKHDMELAEQKSKFTSDKERLEQLNDKLIFESKDMKLELAEQKSKFALDKERLEQLNDKLNAESKNIKQELAEQKSMFTSDNERLEQLNDKLNVESKNMKQMLAEKDRSFRAASETIDRLQTLLKSYLTGGSVHLMKVGVPDRCMFLHCVPLKYDTDRVKLDKVHIDAEGDLVNMKSDTRPVGEGRLKNYWGTCSTAPLPFDGCTKYWEVDNRVSLDKPLSGDWLILEVGVCRGEQGDMSQSMARYPHSYCMNVVYCPIHDGICRKIWKEGKCVLCLPDTLPKTGGESRALFHFFTSAETRKAIVHTLHYGVVYDDARKKIVFLDVKEKKVMSTLDNVDSSEPLWPMFGVHNSHLFTVNMKLVVGSDINMTEEKKAMIVEALS